MKNSQKGFANIVLVVVIVILIGTVGYFAFVKKSEPVAQQPTPTPALNTQTPTPTSKPTISSFEVKKENGKMVLYKIYSDGTSQKTGLEVTLVKAGTYEVPVKIVVSPDKTKAVFNKWNNTILKTEIYASNIDGTNIKLLTQQEVGEGGGGLNQDSLAWSSDGKYITYFESQIACEAGCAPGSVISYKVTYQVNVAIGEKKVISKVPDQYENNNGQGGNQINVTFPNGPDGWESFQRGDSKMLQWVGSSEIRYDIKLIRNCSSPGVRACTADQYIGPFTIRPSITGFSYQWLIADVWDKGIGPVDGAYYIQICEANTSNCDVSNGYFNLSTRITN